MKKLLTLITAIFLMTACGEEAKEHDENLVGTWAGSLIDEETGEKMSPMTMEFTEDGHLIYTFDPGTDMQESSGVNFFWWTKDGYLYKAYYFERMHKDKAEYRIDGDKLTITNGKSTNEFVKQ